MKRILQGGMERGYGTGVWNGCGPGACSGPPILTCPHLGIETDGFGMLWGSSILRQLQVGTVKTVSFLPQPLACPQCPKWSLWCSSARHGTGQRTTERNLRLPRKKNGCHGWCCGHVAIWLKFPEQINNYFIIILNIWFKPTYTLGLKSAARCGVLIKVQHGI